MQRYKQIFTKDDNGPGGPRYSMAQYEQSTACHEHKVMGYNRTFFLKNSMTGHNMARHDKTS